MDKCQQNFVDRLGQEMNDALLKANEGACCNEPAERIKAEFRVRILSHILKLSESAMREVLHEYNHCSLQSLRSALKTIETVSDLALPLFVEN